MKIFASILSILFTLNTSAQTATCQETNETGTEDTYPVTTKTCKYKNIQTVTTCRADYSGHYDCDHQLQLDGKPVNNHEIFNQKQNELLNKLNTLFQDEFNKLKKDASNLDCMGVHKFKPQKMDALGIEFDNDKVKFVCLFGLPLMCGNIDEGIVTLKLTEVERYLK
jgi:hypothetical protein